MTNIRTSLIFTILSATFLFCHISYAEDLREEKVQTYLRNFAGGNLNIPGSKMHTALSNALMKLPEDIFNDVTNRDRPIIFIDYYTTGIAKYAGSTEYIVEQGDPPTFKDGFYLIRLGDALNEADNVEAIEGVILHEIAHRVLEHLRNPKLNCEMEREANRLVISWGHKNLHSEASKQFGAKQKSDSPCYEEKEKKQ